MFELTKEVTKIVVKNEKFKDVTIFVPEDGLYSFAYSCYFEKTDITSY